MCSHVIFSLCELLFLEGALRKTGAKQLFKSIKGSDFQIHSLYLYLTVSYQQTRAAPHIAVEKNVHLQCLDLDKVVVSTPRIKGNRHERKIKSFPPGKHLVKL